MAGTKLLTVYEAEAERNIPYSTLLRLIHSGELSAVKLPGRRRYLIDPADLDALIESSKSAGKVDQKVDQTPLKTNAKPQQNRWSKTLVKTGQYVPKSNWYKKLG